MFTKNQRVSSSFIYIIICISIKISLYITYIPLLSTVSQCCIQFSDNKKNNMVILETAI